MAMSPCRLTVLESCMFKHRNQNFLAQQAKADQNMKSLKKHADCM